jgi:hypothetical protein
MTTETIYLVYGHTGEYEDFMEWTVRAFTSKATAEQLVLKAQEAADTIFKGEGRYGLMHGTVNNPHDPEMRMDYTGTKYDIQEVMLELGEL